MMVKTNDEFRRRSSGIKSKSHFHSSVWDRRICNICASVYCKPKSKEFTSWDEWITGCPSQLKSRLVGLLVWGFVTSGSCVQQLNLAILDRPSSRKFDGRTSFPPKMATSKIFADRMLLCWWAQQMVMLHRLPIVGVSSDFGTAGIPTLHIIFSHPLTTASHDS